MSTTPEADYLPLAEAIVGPARADLAPALARLLEAAAGGIGHRTRGELGLDPARPLPPELFAEEGGRVLLPRYAARWRAVRTAVERRMRAPRPPFADAAVAAALDAVLPSQRVEHDGAVVFDNAGQRRAVAALVDARIGVLTGGPGTGKTTTAAALIAVLRRLVPGLRPEDVLLAAPTGKAACRLAGAIADAAAKLPLADAERAFLRALRPLTLHRLLGWTPLAPERGGPFRHRAAVPLPGRLVLVDEASMVDLELMAHLVDALPEDASLLLLGDSDQLDSVETGGVLAELVARGAGCMPVQAARWSARTGTAVAPGDGDLPGLCARLDSSYRAKDAPWILALARLARPGGGGDWAAFIACCAAHRAAGRIVAHIRAADFRAACRAQWQRWCTTATAWRADAPPAEAALQDALQAFQLLCATNAQVDRANRAGLALLRDPGQRDERALPHGCPVIVLENRPELGLANGDVGVAGGGPRGAPATVVRFHGNDRLIPVPMLPEHRPAFALTIHKSQGSEWRRVAIELPDASERPLARNLLYTAITRAREALDLAIEHEATWRAVLEGAPAGAQRSRSDGG